MEARYGFIREKIDIKILILFVLNRIDEPVDLVSMTEITLLDDAISYFDFADCVADLVQTEHLSLSCDKYSITEKGKTNGEITESRLPYSVRIKAEAFAADLRKRIRREALIKTNRTIRRGGGYDVSLVLSDGIGEIMNASVYAADEKTAKMIETGFTDNAEKAYNAFLSAILSK